MNQQQILAQALIQDPTTSPTALVPRNRPSQVTPEQRAATWKSMPGIVDRAVSDALRFALPKAMTTPQNEMVQQWRSGQSNPLLDTFEVGMPGAGFARPAGSLASGISRVDKKVSDAVTPALADALGAPPKPLVDHGILEGTELLPNLKVGKKNNQDLIAQEFDKRFTSHYGGNMAEWTPANQTSVATRMADEVEYALKKPGSALGWYEGSLDEAHKLAAQRFPELRPNANGNPPTEASIFNFIMATTSNGKTVPWNSEATFKIYEDFRKTGVLDLDHPMLKSAGAEGKVMRQTFDIYNRLTAKLGGPDEFFKFMHSDFTVSELQKLGFNISGEHADVVVKGSAIMGPKLGQGFFQNLEGNFNPLTSDRWWMKTWGRLTGTMSRTPTPETKAKRYARLRDELTPALRKQYGVTKKDLKDDAVLEDLAKRMHRDDLKAGYIKGDDGKRLSVFQAAQRVKETKPSMVVYPTPAERKYMRAAAKEAQEMLAKRGVKISTADIQAVLWYHEKEMMGKLGAANDKAKPTDYPTEFRRLLGGGPGRTRAVQPVAPQSGQQGPRPADIWPSQPISKQALELIADEMINGRAR